MTVDLVFATAASLAAAHYGLLPWLVRRAFRAPRQPATETPAQWGLDFETLSIPARNHKRLFGWVIPAGPEGHGAAVVLLHGWGGNAGFMLPLAPLFHQAGYTVLLLDARNHGRSDDDDFSSMVKFAEDLESGIDWLVERGVVAGPTAVAVVGHSVGAAASLLTASRTRLGAVVSLASFAHPRELMKMMMAAHRIPYVPVGWWVLRYIEGAIGARYDEIAPVSTIARVRCPVLLVHGERDRRVPPADAGLIHAHRLDEGVQLLRVADAGHNSVEAIRRHGARLLSFLDAAGLPRRGRAGR